MLGLAAVVLAAAAGAGVLLAGGRYDSHPGALLRTSAGRRAAPSWTRPCWFRVGADKGHDDCERVRGRVAWIERADPDGDGDRHLIVVARLHVHIVKLNAAFPIRRLPSIGATISASGPTLTGASGRVEIDARRLTAGGRTVVAGERPFRVRRGAGRG